MRETIRCAFVALRARRRGRTSILARVLSAPRFGATKTDSPDLGFLRGTLPARLRVDRARLRFGADWASVPGRRRPSSLHIRSDSRCGGTVVARAARRPCGRAPASAFLVELGRVRDAPLPPQSRPRDAGVLRHDGRTRLARASLATETRPIHRWPAGDRLSGHEDAFPSARRQDGRPAARLCARVPRTLAYRIHG